MSLLASATAGPGMLTSALGDFGAITAYLAVAFLFFMVWFTGPWLVRFAIGIMKRGKK